MTRKRFVKLLMGVGVQRNEANLLALLAQQKYRGVFVSKIVVNGCEVSKEGVHSGNNGID